MTLIETVSCVNASSSCQDFPFVNLNFGAHGSWVSDEYKPFPAFLNFDLNKNHLLEKVRFVVEERESAPREMCLDYFGNDLKLIGRDISKFEFDATDDSFSKCQVFPLETQIHSVKFIRIRILNSWGAKFVKIKCIDIFGKPSDDGVRWTRAEERDPSEYAQWYIGDRVRYLGPDGKKWYEGRILHINPSETYLIQDDHGWVKDHIKPKNTRNPRYARKPRKLKASTSQLSVTTIVEDKVLEEEFSDSSSSSDGSYDEAPFVMKEEYEQFIKSNSLNNSEVKEEVKEVSDEFPSEKSPGRASRLHKKAVIAQGFIKEALNGVYTITDKLMGGRPMFKDGGGRVIWWYSDVKTWMICMESLVGTDRAYACALDSAMHPADIKIPWNVYNKMTGVFGLNPGAKISIFDSTVINLDEKEVDIPDTVIAKDFTKSLNGTYKLTSAKQYGRPMFQREDMKIVLWWYIKTRMWMFSPAKYVGTEKCYSYCSDTAMYPYDVEAGWISYTSASNKYVPDPGKVIVGKKNKTS